MGRVTSKGNEAKSKMKQPSEMTRRDSNTVSRDLWSNTLPLDHGGAPNRTVNECVGGQVFYFVSAQVTHRTCNEEDFGNCFFIYHPSTWSSLPQEINFRQS